MSQVIRQRNLKVFVAVIGLIGSLFSPLVPFIAPITSVIEAFNTDTPDPTPAPIEVDDI